MKSASLLLLLGLLFLTGTLADGVSDTNSAAQVKMIWNYLQLRAPDIFTTTSTSTSLASIAAAYYGNSQLASIIQESNPGLQDPVTSSGVQIVLPSILKCTEQYSVDCILSSYLVKGLNIPQLSLQASLYPLTHPNNQGRLLAGLGEEYDLASDEGHYLVEQFPELRPTTLALTTVNRLGTWLKLKTAGERQNIGPGSSYLHSESVIPLQSISKAVAFTTFQGAEYLVNVTVTLNPVSTFPFFYPAQQNTISAVITGPNGFSQQIPQIVPTQGSESILIDSPLYLNLTLSLDNDFETTTAVVTFQEYYATVLSGLLNRVTNIFPITQTTNALALQVLNQPLSGFEVMTNYINGGNRSATFAWRFIPQGPTSSFFRIISYVTNEVITADPNSFSLSSSPPDLSDAGQVWTLVPAPNVANVGPEFSLFYVKNQNLCWSLDKTEPTPVASTTQRYPLRLRVCNPADTSQIFAFYYPLTGALDWSS